MSDVDLLDELFPQVAADPAGGCLFDFIAKLRLEPINPDDARLAIASIGETVADPIPTIVMRVRKTTEGAVKYVIGWIYFFVVMVVLALVWFLVALKVITWQAALIFTVFLIVFSVIMVFLTVSTTSSFVQSSLNNLGDYIVSWATVNLPLLPAAIGHALCVYTFPPSGTPPALTSASGPVPKAPCIFGGCGESKKSV
jgi:hypothetical protein